MIGFYDDLDFETPASRYARRRPHYFLAALVFLAAYFTTITVQAQPDEIALSENKLASITGTVKDADEDWVLITSAGKDIRVNLDDVNLNGEADTIFVRGMTVTVDGRMKGNDFGVPLMEAKSIVATAPEDESAN